MQQVNVEDFKKFVEATNYITDAEQYGWSVVQENIDSFNILYGVDWKCPDGLQAAQEGHPVTQISYNDALAYTRWSNTKIPDYDTYWNSIFNDKSININSSTILPSSQVNQIGNVWEITQPDQYGRIRLAGGSYLCSPNSCDGSNKNRVLFVDPETGNTHIGFAVLK